MVGCLETVIEVLLVALAHTASVATAVRVSVTEPDVASAALGVYVGVTIEALLNVPVPDEVQLTDA
jgi:hypothetical protein